MGGHTVGELKEILEKSGVSVCEIISDWVLFDGCESDLAKVESIAIININVDRRFLPEYD